MSIAAAGSAPAPRLITGFDGVVKSAPAPTLVSGTNDLVLTAPVPTLASTGTVTRNDIAGTAPAPRLFSSGFCGEVSAIALVAPAPSLVAVVSNPAIITLALTVPTARLVTTLLRGNTLTAALTAATPIMAAAGYPAYTLTAALIAPAPYLTSTMYGPVAATFATYVLNTRKGALSSYSGFTFNSYTVFNGVVLGCNASGVSVLGTQDKDNAANIDAVVLTGAESYGSSFHKRVPRIYVSGTFAGEMRFTTVTAEGGSRVYAMPWNQATGLVQRRVPVGRGPKSRFWQYGISNVDGCAFSLNDVMTYPTVLRRRVQ